MSNQLVLKSGNKIPCSDNDFGIPCRASGKPFAVISALIIDHDLIASLSGALDLYAVTVAARNLADSRSHRGIHILQIEVVTGNLDIGVISRQSNQLLSLDALEITVLFQTNAVIHGDGLGRGLGRSGFTGSSLPRCAGRNGRIGSGNICLFAAACQHHARSHNDTQNQCDIFLVHAI